MSLPNAGRIALFSTSYSVALMSEVRRYRQLLLAALSIQLLAVLIGCVVLYTCTSGGIPHRNLSETAYWGTVGLLGFMFLGMAVPSTLFVILIMSLLIFSGLNWKKVSFLWRVGFLLWGVYWVFLAYAVCTASD